MTELAPHYLADSKSGFYFYPLTVLIWEGEPSPQVTAKAADGWINARRVVAEGPVGHSYMRDAWMITTEPVTAFAFPQSPINKVVQYRLKDETAVSERYPLVLTPAEYEVKRSAEDPDDDGETGLTYIMYRAIYEKVARDPFIVDVSSMTEMKGEGDENGSWGWEVERTAGLLYGQWYHHLLPGTLYGVADRLAKAIEAQYGKHDYLRSYTGFSVDRDGKFSVRLKLPYDVPVFQTKARYGARGQKLRGTQRVEEFVSIDIEWTQGTRITGATKAEAVAKYKQVEADVLDWIASYDLTVCSHCRGKGYTKINKPKP